MVSRSSLWRRKQSGDPDYRERTRAYGRAYWALNKDRVNARRRKRRRERRRTDRPFRERHRNYHNKHRYGLSQSDYEQWLARQGGVCAICKSTCRRRLAVDHCHASGNVRGLLCIKCNLGLGMYDDDTDRMRAAIAYLERSRRKLPSGSGPGDDTGDAEAGRRFSAEPLAATPPPRATTDGRHPGSRGLATARPE